MKRKRKFIEWLLKKLCNHDWKKIKFIKNYYDYSGNDVGIFLCECTKCGKRKLRKYY